MAVDGDGWHRVGSAADVEATRGARLHARVAGRFVSVVRLAADDDGGDDSGGLVAIDSVCFHAGGPLGLGDIEDIEDIGGRRTCLSCPWHSYKVDVRTGEKYYRAVSFAPDGSLVQGGLKSNGKKQRVHEVQRRADGGIWVRLDTDAAPVASDGVACSEAAGALLVGGGAAAAGADGRRGGGRGLLG